MIAALLCVLFISSALAESNETQTVAPTKRAEVAKEIQTLLEQNKVLLFSKTYCPFSKGVKKILSGYKIKEMKVVELDLRPDGKIIQDELEKISHIHTVPQLFVDKKFVGNFDMINKMEKNNSMHEMLKRANVI